MYVPGCIRIALSVTILHFKEFSSLVFLHGATLSFVG